MLCIIDLDDTLANTTRDLEGSPSNLPRLTVADGALEFLANYGWRSILLSVGDPLLQTRKLAHLGIGHFFRSVAILAPPERSENPSAFCRKKLRAMQRLIPLHGANSKDTIVIGDRLNCEITAGNALSCRTVRMRLRGGKYSGTAPWSPLQIPNLTVGNFAELSRHFAASS